MNIAILHFFFKKKCILSQNSSMIFWSFWPMLCSKRIRIWLRKVPDPLDLGPQHCNKLNCNWVDRLSPRTNPKLKRIKSKLLKISRRALLNPAYQLLKYENFPFFSTLFLIAVPPPLAPSFLRKCKYDLLILLVDVLLFKDPDPGDR